MLGKPRSRYSSTNMLSTTTRLWDVKNLNHSVLPESESTGPALSLSLRSQMAPLMMLSVLERS